ncbi:transposase [Vibrio sp. 1180_3]|uniref:transposase n=1 Tax=Vibrio sp. 1180_3 TaxID=2528832 RepID=UPI0024052EF6|nr:transposase [Vibrio sp. 1180_3]
MNQTPRIQIISVIDEEIASIEQEIESVINADADMKRNHKLLHIGKVMSRELVYLFGAKKFATAKQAAAFIGLIPQLNESGKLKGENDNEQERAV